MKKIPLFFPLLLALLTQAPAATQPPNVIVMLVDDMGIMDTSVPFLTDASGKPHRYPLNDFYRTPNMEKLAARGIRFNQFCAMSVCSPTRISILTGQNAARHRTTNWINPDKDNAGPQGPPEWNWRGLKKTDITLPALLRTKGYRTIHVGKGHFAPREFAESDPIHLGFDVNVGGAAIGQPGSYYGLENFGGKGKRGATHAVPGLAKYHGQDIFLTEALTREAGAHLSAAAAAGQPFFLYFAQYAVHAPFNPDPRFAAPYTDSGKPANAQAFATLIEGMDKSLGDLLALVDSLGVAGNTLVILLGDNGSDAPLGHEHAVACAAPLRGKKGSHYEGGMRVPFLAAWAKPSPDSPIQRQVPIAPGALQTQMAAVYDLFPTLLSLAGVSVPPGHVVDGAPLQTLFTGQPDPARSETFLMHYPHSPHRSNYFTSFREGDWKVVYHYFPSPASGDSHYQLFDLRQDPFEQTNLATSHPGDLRRLMTGLVAALEAQKALYPLDKPGGLPVKPLIP
ncbi:MAG: sulfatase-like hydrolase/transferase [Verrucomicrobia bacterium]|nr:sulfatase-like hydrolase/transferase [Verrucomicrobiota bacterium]